jgi:hypothetical protein
LALVVRRKPGQVIVAVMDASPDPAAVFASAKSLYDACMKRAEGEPGLDLSEAYHGMDGFMREVMRVGEEFEKWACRHVVFDELDEVWPYLLEGRFGSACLEIMEAGSLAGFDADDCLRIGFKLRLPMRVDGSMPLPLCVEVPNPVAGAEFQRLRIQTVRPVWDEEGEFAVFTEDDDPCDENYAAPVCGIYGVTEGVLEHLAERKTYAEARALSARLLPGIGFPEEVIAFARPLSPGGGVDGRE